jgi:hypothetical protein
MRINNIANWVADNPVLDNGVLGQEIETGLLKRGDGFTAWNSLAYNFDYYSPTSGTDTYAATLRMPPIISYYKSFTARIQFVATNTGASTININGLGAQDIKSGGVAVTAGQLSGFKILIHNGTYFELIGGGGAGGGETLAQTLALGKVTGGNDIEVSNGDRIKSLEAGVAFTSKIAIWDGSNKLEAADTTTYPNLTELSYVKGATSSIQTQLDTKTTIAQVRTMITYRVY